MEIGEEQPTLRRELMYERVQELTRRHCGALWRPARCQEARQGVCLQCRLAQCCSGASSLDLHLVGFAMKNICTSLPVLHVGAIPDTGSVLLGVFDLVPLWQLPHRDRC